MEEGAEERGWGRTKTVPNLPVPAGGRTGDGDRAVQTGLVYGPPDGSWRVEGGCWRWRVLLWNSVYV